ncbi:MAG: hypothetical protein JSV21_06360 [Nitrospirota bacterium]|nr:MAG: hypothetical protein JSV21_06360 [Nitrospirota bacterium]
MKEQGYTDIICKRFCSFYREGKEGLLCGTYIYLKENYEPSELEQAIIGIGASPSLDNDDIVSRRACNECEFRIDGCDFRDGIDSPPCGGYIIVEHIVKKEGS